MTQLNPGDPRKEAITIPETPWGRETHVARETEQGPALASWVTEGWPHLFPELHHLHSGRSRLTLLRGHAGPSCWECGNAAKCRTRVPVHWIPVSPGF